MIIDIADATYFAGGGRYLNSPFRHAAADYHYNTMMHDTVA